MKKKKIISILCLVAVVGSLAACGTINNTTNSKKETQADASSIKAEDQEKKITETRTEDQPEDELTISIESKLSHDPKFGGAYMSSYPIKQFLAAGFDFGDSVDIVFSNGAKYKNIPFLSGFYTKRGADLLVGYPGYDFVKFQRNCGEDLWDLTHLSEEITATISLNEKGKFSDVENSFKLSYSNDRNEYESDEEFANYRNVKTGDIKENKLYRSASPCDNKYNRAGYTDKLAEKDKIGFVIDLADTDEEIKEYIKDDNFDSAYFKSLYDDNKVAAVDLASDYGSEEYKEKLGTGLIKSLDSEGPLLIHCTEGKDRTGFVLCVLEALCGGKYNELREDYMITYKNYYHITAEDNEEQYNIIADTLFGSFIEYLTDKDIRAVKDYEIQEAAKKYLMECGLDGFQIEQLHKKLCQ